MAKYQVLYWHEIPLQVRARDKNSRYSQPLPDRFQEAIDKAAMVAGVTNSESYTDGFQWSRAEERAGAAEEVAKAVAAELDVQCERIAWRQTAAALMSD